MNAVNESAGSWETWKRREAFIVAGLPAVPVLLGWLVVHPDRILRALSALPSVRSVDSALQSFFGIGESVFYRWQANGNRVWDAGLACIMFALAFLALTRLARDWHPFRGARNAALISCVLSAIQALLSSGTDVRQMSPDTLFTRQHLFLLAALATALTAIAYLWLLCGGLRKRALACEMIGLSYLASICAWTITILCVPSVGLSLAGVSAGSAIRYAPSMITLILSMPCVLAGALPCICLLFLVLHQVGGYPVPRWTGNPIPRPVEEEEKRDLGRSGTALERWLLGPSLMLSPEQRHYAAGLWYVLFMATVFVGGSLLGVVALQFTKVIEEPHWREALVTTVVTRVYCDMLVGLALPAIGAAWCVGRVLTDLTRRRRWVALGLSLLVAPMVLSLAASWWMASEVSGAGQPPCHPSRDYVMLFAQLAMVAYPIAAVIVAWGAYRVTQAIALRWG